MTPAATYAGAAAARRLAPLAVVALLGVAALLVPASFGSAGASEPAPLLYGQAELDGSTGCGAAAPVQVDGEGVVAWADLVKVARAAGFEGEDLVTAVAIVEPESSRRRDAYNPAAGGNRGLWQINSVHATLLAGGDWRDPAYNAQMAYKIYADAGDSFRPWEAYTTGRHEPWLDEARAAVGTQSTLPGPSGAPTAAPVVCGAPGEVDPSLVDPGEGPQGSDGLRPRAAKGKAIAFDRWGCEVRPEPCISVVGGYSYRNIAGTNKLSDHATGRANDIMIPDYRSAASVALGNEIAAFFQANAATLGVTYIVWNDAIWNIGRSGEGWRPYGHPGGGRSDTLQHRDHVHVSYRSGA